MRNKFQIDFIDMMSFMNGLVFFAPVALLVRTQAGIGLSWFFILQAILSIIIFLFEIPTGKLTDKIGYKNALVLSQVMMFLARGLLFCAFLKKNLLLFVIEAVVEGIAICFSSGTQSAYLYNTVQEELFAVKSARVSNFGTIGFVISTISYAFIYSEFTISGLLIATIITSFLGVIAAIGIPKEKKSEKNGFEEKISSYKGTWSQICTGKPLLFVVLLACINISYILINFFYVDKLQVCHLSEEWLTPIILGYSIIQLLAEKILEKIEKSKYIVMFVFAFVIAGLSMIVFAITSNVVIVIMVMLFLPLLIDLPAYILDVIQNNYIDEMKQEDKRAEILSVFNMGVNLVENFFLFASAFVADLGVSASFLIIGTGMIVLAIFSYKVLKHNA